MIEGSCDLKRISIGFFLFFIVFVAVGIWRYNHLQTPDYDTAERTKVLMDTLVRIEVFDKDREKAHKAIDMAFSEFEHLDQTFSHYLPNSEVSGINQNAGRNPSLVSDDVFAVLQRSIHFSKISKGTFDVTVGAISQLWDFTGEEPKIPDRDTIEENLEHVGYEKIRIDDEQHVVLSDSGMAIDFGGIAKGYAVDRAIHILKERGVTSSLVDAGGDIGLLGSKPNGEPWRIGIQHPRDMRKMIAVLEIDSGNVATSGDYERFFHQDGRRYHHILDPKTGWPAQGCMSATVLTNTAMDADMLATSIFVLGPDEGLAFIDSLPEVEGIILFEEDGRIEHVISQGLQEKITFNE